MDEHRTQDLCPALFWQTIHLKLGRCFYPNLILRTAGHRPFMPSVLRIHPATPLTSHLDPAILDFLNLIKKSPVRLLRQTGIHSIRAPLSSQLDRGSHVDWLTGISTPALFSPGKGLLRLHRPGEFQKVGGNEDIRFQAIDGVAKATTPSWLFVVSSGFQKMLYGRCQQVNDADERVIVAVSPGPAFGGLEDAVERLDASVAVA